MKQNGASIRRLYRLPLSIVLLLLAVGIIASMTQSKKVDAAGNTIPFSFSDNFDSLSNGNISGQNGWTAGGQGTWTVGTDGGSGKILSQTDDTTSVDTLFYNNNVSNGSSTWADEHLKADFKTSNSLYLPQIWLRKSHNTGEADGYLVFSQGSSWSIAKHTIGQGNTYTTLATGSANLATDVWYTVEVSVVDDANSNPVINVYSYLQGGTKPAQPDVSFTDTTKSFRAGYIGLGSPGSEVPKAVSYDNLSVTGFAKQALNITSPATDVQAAPNVATKQIIDEGGDFYIPYIQTSTTLNVTATADAASVPAGGGVKFVLNQGLPGEQTLYDTVGPSSFSTSFSGLAKGTYTLDTYIVNSSHVVQVGSGLHDNETGIGIGDIITDIGDSITAGYPGTISNTPPITNWLQAAAGEVSTDNRNFGQHDPFDGSYRLGYLPELNNILTNYYGYPVFVMNEGWGGLTSGTYDSLTQTDEWKTRQADLQPNKWLIQLGVNDADFGVSESSYNASMQNIVTNLKNNYSATSANIFVAKPLYIQNDPTSNSAEQTLSNDLDSLISTNHLSAGPNFYDYYAPYSSSLYADSIHPNPAGYSEMAKLFGLSITSPLNVNATKSSNTSVHVTWDDLSALEPQVNGYKINYGTSPGVYTSSIDVGDTTSGNVTGLGSGITYYFAVSAYYSDPTSNTVNNSANSSETSIDFPGPPHQPTGVSAVAGRGQATVSFTAPTDDGGFPVTSYTVTSNPGGFTATGTGSPLTVTGLTNGTNYTFTVFATNSQGNGANSSPSNSIMPQQVTDIGLTKQLDDPEDVAPGATIHYTVSVYNYGPDTINLTDYSGSSIFQNDLFADFYPGDLTFAPPSPTNDIACLDGGNAGTTLGQPSLFVNHSDYGIILCDYTGGSLILSAGQHFDTQLNFTVKLSSSLRFTNYVFQSPLATPNDPDAAALFAVFGDPGDIIDNLLATHVNNVAQSVFPIPVTPPVPAPPAGVVGATILTPLGPNTGVGSASILPISLITFFAFNLLVYARRRQVKKRYILFK